MKDTLTSNTVKENQLSDAGTPVSNEYKLPVICDVDVAYDLIRKSAVRIVDARKEEAYQE